jgi:adenylyl cyclase-associated protein
MQDVVGRLEAVCARLESAVAKMGGAEVDEDGTPAYVADYDAIIAKELAAVISSCAKLKIKACGTTVRKSFENVGALIAVLHKTAKPANPDLMTFLKEAVAAIKKAEDLKRKRDKRGKPDLGKYRAAMYEVCVMASWVTMSPPTLPAPYVNSQIDSAQFHMNRVLKDAKGKENEADSKEFVAAAKALGIALHTFVKANFKTGLEWKAGGDDLLSAPTTVTKKPVEKKEEVKEEKKEEAKEKPLGNMGNVFGELSKGLNITKGLNKVKKSQKTKYRKKEEGRGMVKTGPKKKNVSKPKRTPTTRKMGFRWMIQGYYEGIVDIPAAIDMKANVFISSCSDCQMEVKQKVKAITIEGCKKVSLFVSDVVSSIEMVRCDTVTIYCRGNAPNIQIDKCDSPRVIVLKGAVNPNLVVSCVTAGNVEVFKPTDDNPDGMIAFAMPEQFQLQITGDNDGLSCNKISHG